jgi:hypothetical protein
LAVLDNAVSSIASFDQIMSKATKERVSRTSTENEAKALSEELAALLADKSPWNPDVVFAREKCVC